MNFVHTHSRRRISDEVAVIKFTREESYMWRATATPVGLPTYTYPHSILLRHYFQEPVARFCSFSWCIVVRTWMFLLWPGLAGWLLCIGLAGFCVLIRRDNMAYYIRLLCWLYTYGSSRLVFSSRKPHFGWLVTGIYTTSAQQKSCIALVCMQRPRHTIHGSCRNFE